MLKTLRSVLFLGIAAGTLIGIGGTAFVACTAGNCGFVEKLGGSVLFAVALLTICSLGMYLYTGKICYILDSHKPVDFASLAVGLLGNYIGSLFVGLIVSYASPALYERARAMTAAKLGMKWYQVIIMAFLCDILIYAAVHIFKVRGSISGIVFAIPAFIICGFEHSVADMFYVSAARSFTPKTLLFIVLVVIGNTLGGIFIPALFRLAGKNEK